jgi:hypothetical protein
MKKTSFPAALPGLVKPTLDTPFRIDTAWWDRQNRDLTVEVRSHLCDAHQDVYSGHTDVERIDWINAQTGEVTRVDGLEHVLRVHCSKQPDYITERLNTVEALVRVFLANGNQPMTSRQLGEMIGRPAERILRTLSGRRVYKGIRPVH